MQVLHIITMHHAQMTTHKPGGTDLRTAEKIHDIKGTIMNKPATLYKVTKSPRDHETVQGTVPTLHTHQ